MLYFDLREREYMYYAYRMGVVVSCFYTHQHLYLCQMHRLAAIIRAKPYQVLKTNFNNLHLQLGLF